MSKKKNNHSALSIFLYIFLFLFGLELTFAIGYFLKSPLSETISNIQFVPFKLDTSKLTYQEPKGTETVLTSLTILPTEYTSFTKKYGTLTQHEKTELLRYSTTTHKTETTNLTELYVDIYNNNFNILIPSQYLDIYFLTQFQDIENKIKAEKTLPSTSQELSQIFQKDLPLHNDLETVDITNVSDFSLLGKWLLTPKQISDENDYATFLDSIYNEYIKSEKATEILEEETLNSGYTGSIYYDTNPIQLSKIDYMLQFLSEVYTQAKLSNNEILNQINFLKQHLQSLKDSNTAEIPLEEILTNSNLNIYDQGEPVSLLIRNFSGKTYLAPTYTFSQKFVVNDKNFNEPYDVKPVAQSKGSTRVPIFMYHQIGNPPKEASKFVAGLYVTPEQFEEQMAYLVKNNYKTIGSLELYNLLKKGGNPSQKTVMITFDDGTYGQYKYAFPILKKYGLKATYYIVSNRSSIRAPQLKEMAQAGMEIASHSATHPNFVNLKDLDQLTYEIYSSKSILAARTGKPVYGIAYPGCVADSRVFSRVAGAGYLIGGSCGRSIDHYLSKRLSLSRVHAFGDVKSFKKLLSGGY